jgi:hypothetical protein
MARRILAVPAPPGPRRLREIETRRPPAGAGWNRTAWLSAGTRSPLAARPPPERTEPPTDRITEQQHRAASRMGREALTRPRSTWPARDPSRDRVR